MVNRKARVSPEKLSWTTPIWFIPCLSKRSPVLAHRTIAKTITRVLKRNLRSCPILCCLVVRGNGPRLRDGDQRLLLWRALALARPLQTLRAQLQEVHRLVIEALALVFVPQGFAHDAPDDARPKIILIVKLIDASHHLFPREMQVLDMGELVASGISQRFHLQKSFASHLIVEFRAGHGMSERNLNRFAIHFLGEFDCLLNGLSRLAGQPDDEVAVDLDADLLAVLHKGAAHFHRRPLPRVFEVLRRPRLPAPDGEACAGVRPRLERLLVAGPPRRTGP